MLNLVFDKWYIDGPLPNGMDETLVNYILFEYENAEKTFNHLPFQLGNKFGPGFNMWNNFFGFELEKKELKCIPYTNELSNWFYLIEPWGHLSFSCNLFTDKGGVYKNFFKYIPQKIKEDINNGTGALIINYSHEGHVNDWLLRTLYLGIKNNGIDVKNTILILNDLNLENKINKFIEDNNIERDNFPKVINHSYYVDFSSFYFYNKYQHLEHTNDIYFTNKTHKFLFLNRRLETHKLELLVDVYSDIVDQSIISYDKKLLSPDGATLVANNIRLEEKFNRLPTKMVADIEELDNVNGYKDESTGLYEKTLISIITETNFYNENNFVSEKIFKPLFHLQPFIVLGRPHKLEYLKKLGFKTFDWLIDETYDTIENDSLRMEMVKLEIQKLSKISFKDLQEKILEKYDILLYNQELIKKIGKNKSKIELGLIDILNNYKDIDYVDLIQNIKYE